MSSLKEEPNNDQPNDELARATNFTRRELEILILVADGWGSEKIGKKLHLSAYTVQTHRRNMQARNNCSNSVALVSYAFRMGIIR